MHCKLSPGLASNSAWNKVLNPELLSHDKPSMDVPVLFSSSVALTANATSSTSERPFHCLFFLALITKVDGIRYASF